jgi:hypothetical protein
MAIIKRKTALTNDPITESAGTKEVRYFAANISPKAKMKTAPE